MYETGTATGVVDLVNKLATFVEANGWTRDSLADEASGRRYHAHRSSQYLNMRAYVNEAPNSEIKNRSASGVYGVALNVGTGYNGATAWYKQAGAPTDGASVYLTAGIIKATGAITAYHFFAHNSGDQIYAFVEYASGKYQYFGWGQMSKFGTFTGGDFMFGSTEGVKTAFSYQLGSPFEQYLSFGSAHYISIAGEVFAPIALAKVDVDSETGWHTSVGMSASTSARRLFDINSGLNVAQQYTVPNSVNAVVPILPIRVHVTRTAAASQYAGSPSIQHAPIGEIPNFFTCSLAALTPGQRITFGSDHYRAFPTYAKGASYNDFDQSDASTRNSGYYGIAIKE